MWMGAGYPTSERRLENVPFVSFLFFIQRDFYQFPLTKTASTHTCTGHIGNTSQIAGWMNVKNRYLSSCALKSSQTLFHIYFLSLFIFCCCCCLIENEGWKRVSLPLIYHRRKTFFLLSSATTTTTTAHFQIISRRWTRPWGLESARVKWKSRIGQEERGKRRRFFSSSSSRNRAR